LFLTFDGQVSFLGAFGELLDQPGRHAFL